jgi:hypothetical protein
MSAVKYNARDCVFQIYDTIGAAYVAIGGLDTFAIGRDSKDTDLTTYASAGSKEGQVMERGKTLKLDGFRLQDQNTGALDPGQKLVEALADGLGDASLGTIRFAAPGDTTYEVWTAFAVLGDTGGGNNDKAKWSVTLTRSGASSTAARP